jgi:hypothetical protein
MGSRLHPTPWRQGFHAVRRLIMSRPCQARPVQWVPLQPAFPANPDQGAWGEAKRMLPSMKTEGSPQKATVRVERRSMTRRRLGTINETCVCKVHMARSTRSCNDQLGKKSLRQSRFFFLLDFFRSLPKRVCVCVCMCECVKFVVYGRCSIKTRVR